MTKHQKIETRSAQPLEIRSDENDPLVAATAAVEQIRSAAEQRHTAHQTEVRGLTDRIAQLETRLNRPGTQQEERNEPSDEQRSFGIYLRRGDAGLSEIERRALTVGNDTSAGFLAPETFGNEILKTLAEYSPIRNYAKVVQIAGPEIKYPKRLTGTNADWVAEIANRPESAPTYGQVTLTPYELATFVEVSKQLLEDAAYDVEGEIRDAVAEDFGAKEGAAFVSGNGVGKPNGILNATGIAEVVSGHASTLGSAPGDLLIDLMAKLPTAYANNGAWLMNRLTLAAVRKLKDAQGAYLWQPGIQAGQPSTLLGRPVIEAVDMDSVAAGKFPIVFGDWSGYRIVDRVGLSILTDPFTRAKNGITVFHARKRVGGDVTNAEKFVKLKIAAS
ncbi:phage major capsid protein [Mesorhizobium sp. SB112]|uniref:phage major capsid protein n=1 Tax=Mesorhizobium sp. SB112 TaxID=3151853 RepID=UPI003263F0CE